MEKKIVLTGFEPFGGEKINPSWEIVKTFNGEKIFGFKIKAFRLPVSYKRAREMVLRILNGEKPQIFIGFGQAGGRARISLERVALNLMDGEKPDVDGYRPRGELIFKDAPLAYFTNINVDKIVDILREEGYPVTVSNHAGAYICNLVFFTAFYARDKFGLDSKIGFIHVPYSIEQILKKERPGLPLDYMRSVAKRALELIVKDFENGVNNW